MAIANNGLAEETLIVLRRACAQAAVLRLRWVAAARGINKLSATEIEAEIAQVRQARHRAGQLDSRQSDNREDVRHD